MYRAKEVPYWFNFVLGKDVIKRESCGVYAAEKSIPFDCHGGRCVYDFKQCRIVKYQYENSYPTFYYNGINYVPQIYMGDWYYGEGPPEQREDVGD